MLSNGAECCCLLSAVPSTAPANPPLSTHLDCLARVLEEDFLLRVSEYSSRRRVPVDGRSFGWTVDLSDPQPPSVFSLFVSVHRHPEKGRCKSLRMASAPRQALAAVSLLLSALLILLLVACFDLLGGVPEGTKGLAMSEENSLTFRAHQVQDQEATSTSRGVTKFVLQEYSGPPASAERGASSSDGLRSPASSPWRTLSFGEVADLWQSSPSFVGMFAASLAAVPYDAMFWESMPVTKSTMVRKESFAWSLYMLTVYSLDRVLL